jgi:hypothetical protein
MVTRMTLEFTPEDARMTGRFLGESMSKSTCKCGGKVILKNHKQHRVKDR